MTYDFMFVYWYTVAFGLKQGERCPFGFQGKDIKTLAADRLKIPFKESTKKNFPRRWFEWAPAHTHKALDDALGQGVLYVNIMNDKSN